ncbi:hypothetical protein BKA70DRAFT_1399222 [Coprinopsis sp. MPI-PUGE-AT-0042]|nr:hypothetical protein BKA70DRAFT_1399222 [Coprinopsis sp. MPI-PUGE-AT-0042]
MKASTRNLYRVVEGLLFKVPNHHFVKASSYFAINYCLPGADAVQRVWLPDARVDEFRSPLRVLYPRLSKDEWLSVLKLSTRWFFNDLRNVANAQLEHLELTDTERVVLGKKYHISRWVLAGYDGLVRHLDGLIPYDDAQQIGCQTTLVLYMCREKRLYDGNPKYLQDAFKKGLEDLAKEEAPHLLSAGRTCAVERNADKVKKDEADHKKRFEEAITELDQRQQEAERYQASFHKLEKERHHADMERQAALEQHPNLPADLRKALSESQAALKQKQKEHDGALYDLARSRHLLLALRKALSEADQALAKEKEERKRDREEYEKNAGTDPAYPAAQARKKRKTAETRPI